MAGSGASRHSAAPPSGACSLLPGPGGRWPSQGRASRQDCVTVTAPSRVTQGWAPPRGETTCRPDSAVGGVSAACAPLAEHPVKLRL